MAINETPIIDQASRHCEKSERRLKDKLNQETGFICREDVPDKGCDFHVELILDGGSISSTRFPIQLKSIETLKIVSNNEFISYPFETSRLGYLLRWQPTMGIVALYSLETDLIYFDYADKIYERLMEERSSDKWHNNHKVNILIPITNVLNDETVPKLHTIFAKRIENAVIMQLSHGNKYNLPAIDLRTESEFDFNNIEDVKKILQRYGVLFLNDHDIHFIFELLVRIPHLEICANKELLLFAAVSYCKVGKHSDSTFYTNKLLRRGDLSIEERMMADFTRLKNNLALGEIGTKQFVEEIKVLKSNSDSGINSILLEINITFYELLSIKTLHLIPDNISDSIKSVFSKIKELSCKDNTKSLLEVWNAENFAILISNYRQKAFSELRITESLGGEFTLAQKMQRITFLTSLQSQFITIIDRLNNFANESGDKLLKASIINVYSRHVISQEIDYIAYDFPSSNTDNDKKHEELLINNIQLALASYNSYLEFNYTKEVYQSMCNALELIAVAQLRYKYHINFDVDQLLEIKRQMEDVLELDNYELVIPSLLRKQREHLVQDDNAGTYSLKSMDDSEIENLAKTVIAAYKLSSNSLSNVINAMKSYREFYNRCLDDSLEIIQLQDKGAAYSNLYSEPAKFILKSKKTGIQTNPNTNIDELLKSWGL